MAAVFPEPEYKLQPVTPGHPIWRMQDMVRPDSPYVGQLWASNTAAARASSTATRIFPATGNSPGPANGTTTRPTSMQHIADALAIGVNVLTYATNREPKGKEQSFDTPLADESLDADDRPAASSKSPSSATAAAATTRPARC